MIYSAHWQTKLFYSPALCVFCFFFLKDLLLARLLGIHDTALDRFWVCRYCDFRRWGYCRKADNLFSSCPSLSKRSSWFKKWWDAFSRSFHVCFPHFFFKGWVGSVVCQGNHVVRGILLILCGLLTSCSVLAAQARILFWKYQWEHDTVKTLVLRAM